MELGEQSWVDADAVGSRCVLVPVGSTEQHGPHAPLGTDALIAKTMADAGANAYDAEVVVTPPIPVGVSQEHRKFAGTLWVRPSTLRAYLRDVVVSCRSHGWDRVVLVNGHGGNVGAVDEVSASLTREYADLHVVSFTWFDVIDTAGYEMGHAGGLETAVLRAAYPELVQEDRVEDAAASASDQWGRWVGGVNLSIDTDEFTENGVVGDPRDGDAELGRELITAVSESLCSVLDAITAE